MVTTPELGWMAAVIDLKGILLRKKNQTRATPQLVIVVESREHKVIEKLAELTGGNPEAKRVVNLKDWMRRGCIEHCPEAHVHHADKWQMPLTKRWTVTGIAAAVVLHNLRPFLVADKPYDDFLNEALENAVVTGRGSGVTRQALARLIGLGWTLPDQLTSELLAAAALARDVAAAKKEQIPA